MASGLDATKTGARPSHEAVESTGGKADKSTESASQRLDQSAMESAKRAQIRIKDDEQKNPEDTIFTGFGDRAV